MAKLIQICASQNDLFGLDGEGMVYQYNFNLHTWMELGREWSDEGGGPRAQVRSTPKARSAAAGRNAEPSVTRRRE
ncbi:MAG TPA: hypothetical protein VK548_29455 [Candidatus Acidoferrum sp.]|nr:hypothetical protein [Candidatus Acidoferrum sp.]